MSTMNVDMFDCENEAPTCQCITNIINMRVSTDFINYTKNTDSNTTA